MTPQFNPFAVVNHNQHRWPRLGFHAAHIAIGLPIALVALVLHCPIAWTVAASFLMALLDKCLWFDWNRSSGSLLHWTGLHGLDDPWHFASDAGFTLLGALCLSVSPWLWLAYYPLSIVNDV